MPSYRRWLLAPALALLLAGAGCATPDATEEVRAGTAGQSTDAALHAVESAYSGDYTEPPASSPPPAPGQDVWIISAWQQVHALAYQAERVGEAARLMGWTTNVCDGQNNANGGWASCVRQATAAKADGIVLLSVDCAPVRQALVEAKAAAIRIASLSAFDCDDPSQGASEPLFDAPARHHADAPTIADYYTRLGQLRADLVIAETGGQAKVLHVAFRGVAFGDYVSRGFADRLASCSGCTVLKTLEVAAADVPNVRQKFESALVQVPQANAIAVDVDHFFVAGIQQALISSGRTGLTVVGSECQIDDLDYVRAGGGEQYCFGASAGYRAYSTVDALNRAFNGVPGVVAGAGFQLVDQNRNLPPAGTEFDGPIDYAAAYEKAWGV